MITRELGLTDQLGEVWVWACRQIDRIGTGRILTCWKIHFICISKVKSDRSNFQPFGPKVFMPCRPTRCSIRGSKCEKSLLETDRSWTIAICWRDPFRDGAAPAWRIAILFPFRSIHVWHLGVAGISSDRLWHFYRVLKMAGTSINVFRSFQTDTWHGVRKMDERRTFKSWQKNILDGNRQPLILLPLGAKATWWRRSCYLFSHDLRQNAGTEYCVMWEKLQWRSTDILLRCLNRAPGLILSMPRVMVFDLWGITTKWHWSLWSGGNVCGSCIQGHTHGTISSCACWMLQIGGLFSMCCARRFRWTKTSLDVGADCEGTCCRFYYVS